MMCYVVTILLLLVLPLTLKLLLEDLLSILFFCSGTVQISSDRAPRVLKLNVEVQPTILLGQDLPVPSHQKKTLIGAKLTFLGETDCQQE